MVFRDCLIFLFFWFDLVLEGGWGGMRSAECMGRRILENEKLGQ